MDGLEIIKEANKAKDMFSAKLVGFSKLHSTPIQITLSEKWTKGKAASGGPCNNESFYGVFLNPIVINQRFGEYSISGEDQKKYVQYLTCHELAHMFTWKVQQQFENKYFVSENTSEIADLITDEIVIAAFPEFKKFAENEYAGRYHL